MSIASCSDIPQGVQPTGERETLPNGAIAETFRGALSGTEYLRIQSASGTCWFRLIREAA